MIDLDELKKTYKIGISFSLDKYIYDKLKKFCEDEKILKSHLVNKLLKDFFDNTNVGGEDGI